MMSKITICDLIVFRVIFLLGVFMLKTITEAIKSG